MKNQNRNDRGADSVSVPAIDASATGMYVFRLLKERGFTVKQAAELVGCGRPQAVYNWKYGRGMPSIDSLDRISHLLNIPINNLLIHVGEEEKTGTAA